MVYKSLHGLAPDYLGSKFERRETAYNLRDSENKLNVPLPRTNYYKNSFRNSLPRDIRQAESLYLSSAQSGLCQLTYRTNTRRDMGRILIFFPLHILFAKTPIISQQNTLCVHVYIFCLPFGILAAGRLPLEL